MSNGVASASHLVGVVDEHELRVRIHEPAEQPCARRPVDVHPGPGRPPHDTTTTDAANRSTAARATSRCGGGK